MGYVTTKVACLRLGVSSRTLREWDKQKKIRTIRTPGGNRLYDLSSIEGNEGRVKIVYARVSSKNQKDDLQNQIRDLKFMFPEHELVTDFGSGLNFKRQGFTAILDRIMSGDVSEVVVAHKDRLCRFGFEFIERIAEKYGTRIVVLDDSKLSPSQELVNDLLSIIHVFSCRLYGLRKYSRKIKEDKDLPQKGIESPTEEVSGTQSLLVQQNS